MSEHDTQAAFVRWLGLSRIPGIESAHAVPNGGHRHIAVAAKLKAEGVKAGVLDWQWPSPRGGFVGLAIEFKHADGKPSKEQIDRMGMLQRDGWCVVMCWSWEAAARTVQGYAKLMKLEAA